MAFRYEQRVTGSMSFDGLNLTDNRSLTQLVIAQEDRTRVLWKRPKPVGVNLLFDGTDVYSLKKKYVNGTVYNFFPGPPNNPRTWSCLFGAINAAPYGPQPFGTNVPDALWINQLRNRIRDTDINLAQAFAERAQTEKMFVDYGKRLLKSYRALRKGNPSDVFNALLGQGNRPPRGWKTTIRDATGVASESWLAWQYGIRPLISDLKGAVSEYDKVRRARPFIQRYSLKASNPARAGGTFTGMGSYSNPVFVSSRWTQEAKVTAYVEFQDSAQAWDQSAQRLGLTDPLLLAWELIPYSFVIDWFVGVGDYLQASGTFAGLKRIGIHVTTITRGYDVNCVGNGRATCETTIKSRSFRSVLPSAVFAVKANPLSVSHVTSALALIRQLGR